MRTVFFGSDEYSVPHLEKLLELSEVVLVVTTPDKPRGRGRRFSPTVVKEFSMKNGLKVVTPAKLKEGGFLSLLDSVKPELGIVASFGKIIPRSVLEKFELGVFCVHPSLLPRYRGAAPIERALENGEGRIGVTIFKTVEKLDAGPIALQKGFEIGPFETYGEVLKKAIEIGKELLTEFFDLLGSGNLSLVPQDDSKATYAPKIEKDDLRLNFKTNCENVKNKIRAFDPRPGAFAYLRGNRIKIFGVKAISGREGEPGEIIEINREGAWICCSDGAVLVEKLQFPGKNVVTFWDARNGSRVREGDRLE